jgi:arylformamidase
MRRLARGGDPSVVDVSIATHDIPRSGRRGYGRTRIDLSHTVEDGMSTYPGLPGPIVCDYLSRERSRTLYAPGTEFQIGVVTLCSNTGTYVDSPFHRYPDGIDVSELPLDRLADLDAVVIDAAHDARAIDVDAFAGRDVASRAVLVRTGWQRHWRTPSYSVGHPFLTEAAAHHLVAEGALLVGIDSLNIDDMRTGERPVHSVLLAAGVPICEHLADLARLPGEDFRFSAVPVPVRGMGTFPVRAYATIEGDVPAAPSVSPGLAL